MSHEVVFPDDDRWNGPKRLADRDTITIGVTDSPAVVCGPPPSKRKVLVLSANGVDFNSSSITLSFNGPGAKLFGTQAGAPDAFFGIDVPTPSSSSKLPPPTSTTPSLPDDSVPPGPVSRVNCDSVLWEAHGLANTSHTLRVFLQAQGGVYIYNATLDQTSPSTVSRTRLVEFIALPIGCVALLVAVAVVVWLRWRRRKRALAALRALRPYGVVSHTTIDAPGDRKMYLAEKKLPPIPPIALANDDGMEPSTGLSNLERAVELAGFSVSEIVTVLERVHRAGAEEADADRPPGYDRAPDV